MGSLFFNEIFDIGLYQIYYSSDVLTFSSKSSFTWITLHYRQLKLNMLFLTFNNQSIVYKVIRG